MPEAKLRLRISEILVAKRVEISAQLAPEVCGANVVT